MSTDRLEVRLDRERRRKLAEVAAMRGTPVSEAVRAMIDQAYETVMRDRRREAALALSAMTVEDVPEPEELARQLEGAYESTGLS